MSKISVILTLNKNTSGLDSVLNQSYQNIEIIALYYNLSQKQIDDYGKIDKLKLIKIDDTNKWNNRISSNSISFVAKKRSIMPGSLIFSKILYLVTSIGE